MTSRCALLAVAAMLVIARPGRAQPSPEQWTPASPLGQKLFDAHTLMKRWVATTMPGIDRGRLVEAVPALRGRDNQLTGQTRAPVAAVRADASGPLFQLALGVLPIGTYAVRVVAMVPTAEIERWRRPLYVELTVNDRVGGGTTVYRQRVPYWDDFYAVAEIYFNADERRRYTATLTISGDVELDVHSIELHDVLAGLVRRAAKTRPGTYTEAERAHLRANSKLEDVRAVVHKEVSLDPYLRGEVELTDEERRARDDVLWNAVLPPNTQYVSEYDGGWLVNASAPGELSRVDADANDGKWELSTSFQTAWRARFELRDAKLGLAYTLDDLAAHRELPAPYPFPDRGGGVYFAKTGAMAHAQEWLPIAEAVGLWWEGSRLALAPYHGDNYDHRLPYVYLATGDSHAARDAAFMLARWAYLYPTLTDAQILDGAVVAPNLKYNRDERLRWRRFGYQRPITLMLGLLYSYDQLFDYIRGNQELARAVGRYIPWIKTDRDLRAMIETRLVQYAAKQILRWQRWDDEDTPSWLMLAAAVEQDPAITRPWLAELWRHTWVYPYPATGLPELISTTTTRDGTTGIGSVFYTRDGSPFAKLAELAHRYVQNGGDPQFDLSRVDKLARAPLFPLESSVAGGYALTIGDVGGVAEPRIHPDEHWRAGWQWARDPRIAWIIVHVLGRAGETDADWRELVRAAAAFGRNPLLASHSRVLASWAGILEAGVASDDYRKKRAVYLRVGTGHGHSHADTLDLQIVALGLRLAGDLGFRGGYLQPQSSNTMMHDRVEVDDATHPRQGDWLGHSWIATLAPLDGAQFMHAVAVPPPPHDATTKSYTRDVALIDVDDGGYVFDVQRLDGGTYQTWCFHGPWSDQFDSNMTNRHPAADEPYLRKFLAGTRYAGDVPRDQPLVATWRLRRTEETLGDRKQENAERAMLGADYDPNAPPVFLRAYLFGRAGDRVLVGDPTPTGPPAAASTWPFLFVRHANTSPERGVFAALYEPYRGTPILASVRALPVADAIALAVETVNGRHDWLFSDDGATAKTVGDTTVRASFAYRSDDASGLRTVEVVGEQYDAPDAHLAVEPIADAKIVRVAYLDRRIWIETTLPPALWVHQQIEIGNHTSFNVVAAARDGRRTVLTLDAPLDLSFAKVTAVDRAKHQVTVDIGPQDLDHLPGLNTALTLTDASMMHARRVTHVRGYLYDLDGTLDVAPGAGVRLWELGVGDIVHLASYAQLRRAASGYTLVANTAVTVQLRGQPRHVTAADLAAHGGTLAIDLH